MNRNRALHDTFAQPNVYTYPPRLAAPPALPLFFQHPTADAVKQVSLRDSKGPLVKKSPEYFEGMARGNLHSIPPGQVHPPTNGLTPPPFPRPREISNIIISPQNRAR